MGARGLVVLAVLALMPAPARADDVSDDAERFRAAHGAGEEVAPLLSTLKADPWLVVEELLLTDGRDAAEALVAALPPDPLTDGLPAYVRWRADHPGVPDANAWLGEVADTWRSADAPAKALEALDARALTGVSGVRAGRLRSRVVEALDHPPAAIFVAAARAARDAAGIGWLSTARMAFRDAAAAAGRAGLHDEAIALAGWASELARDRSYADWERDAEEVAARARHRLGHFHAAIPHALRVHELAKTPRERRDSLRYVLTLEIGVQRYHTALRRMPRMRELDEAIDDQDGAHATDVQWASVEASLGRYASALARIEPALTYFDEHGAYWQIRGAHINAAKIRLALRDTKRTREHLEIAKEASRDRGLDEAPLLIIEACVDMAEYRFSHAIPKYQLSLTMIENRPLESQVNVRTQLALCLAIVGRNEEARGVLAEARALLPPAGRLPPDLSVHLESCECYLRLRERDYEGAVRVGEAARELLTAGTRPWEALLETRLAHAYLKLGRHQEGARSAMRAVDATLEASTALPDLVGALQRAELSESFALGVDAAVACDDANLLFTFAEKERAVALRERLDASEVLLRAVDPELRDEEVVLEEAEALALDAYRRAMVSGQGDRTRRAFDVFNEAREALERHREHMRVSQSVAMQILHPRVDTLEDARGRTAKGEAVVVYAAGIRHLYALVIEADASRMVPLGGHGPIESALANAALEDPSMPAKQAIAELTALLTEPLGLSEETHRIHVVPTGPLALVPYAALWPDRSIRLLPSVTAGRMIGEREPVPGRVLALAGYDPHLTQPLPAAAAEARAVGDTALVGDQATEEAVRALMAGSGWRALHLACHGLIDPVHPLRSALSLSPSSGRDGLWTVSEILGTTLRVDLVGLSACSSGRGRVIGREGTLGFVHAFFVSGARQVLVSLWKVDDEGAAALMQRFYAAWKPGQDAAEALRAAQTALRNDPRWNHPAHWAGWQIWGEE